MAPPSADKHNMVAFLQKPTRTIIQVCFNCKSYFYVSLIETVLADCLLLYINDGEHQLYFIGVGKTIAITEGH
ncbi:hypothetical protein Tco_0145890 [Tanacetum coccineum]